MAPSATTVLPLPHRRALRVGWVCALALLALAGNGVALAQPAGTPGASASQAAAALALGGNGLVLDGVDDAVTVSKSGYGPFAASFTVEFWARRRQTNRVDMFLTHGTTQAANSFMLMGFRSDNAFTFGFWGNDLNTPAYTDLDWHHWAVTYDATTRARRVYRDAALVAQDVATGAYVGTGPLRFGSGSGNAAGALDEVRVWNAVRTPQQIRDARDRVVPAASAGLVGYWTFETFQNLAVGAAGTNDVADLSASAAHGDVTGGAALAASGYAAPVRASYDLYEDRVTLAWNVTGSATARYQIRRDGLLLTTLAATDTAYTDRAGTAGRIYPYCVTRQDGATLTELGCDDGRRQLLTAGAVSASDGLFTDRVRLAWTDRSAVNTGYRVYRAGALVATLGDVVTFDDTTKAALTPGTPYAFCVAPIQGTGAAAGEGVQACDAGTRGTVLPAASVAATDGTAPNATRITWTAPGVEAGSTAYTVTRDGTAILTAARALTFLDVTGAAGVTYSYCVTRQPPNGPASVAVCDAGGHGTLPALTGLTASDSTRDDRVDVRWAGGGGAADGVHITRQGGGHVVFDGVNDAIEVPAFTRSPSEVTVEAWVRPTGGFVDGASIVTKGRTAAPWSLLTNFDGRLRVAANYMTTGGTAATDVFSTGTLTVGVWQHVAATIGGGYVRFYINGVLAGETAQTITFGANTEPLYIGADYVGTVAFFRGAIDEVRVWSVLRTQAELRAAMYAAATGAEDGLAALYHLDEGGGTLTSDARGGKHGALLGFDNTAASGWQTASAPVAGLGMNNALRLDGVDDHATVPGLTTLPASFTLEFWARRAATGRSDFALGQGTATTNRGLNVGFRDTNAFTFSFTGNDLDTPQTFGDLDWHHWAVTYDGPTRARVIYRDGAEVARDVAANPYAGTGPLQIGKSVANSTFGGDLDDVRIWSRVRPAASIAANRFALADTARTGLVGAWSFDALDASGTAALTTAPGLSATGTPASGAGLLSGAALTLGRPVRLVALPAGATNFADATPEPGLRYTYCAASYANAGAATAAACDAGQRARTVAPVVIVASDGQFENKVTVAWQGASTRAATYSVYRTGTLIATLPATRASYDDAGGAPSTVYTYCVAAFTSDGAESARACDAGSRELKAPTVAATDNTREDRVDVTWTDNSGAETGYRVTRRPDKAFALALPAAPAGASIAANPAYDFSVAGQFTVEAWVRPAATDGQRTLLSRDGAGGPGTSGGFSLGVNNGSVIAKVYDARGEIGVFGGSAPVGVWTHVAVSYVANGQAILYVNGAQVEVAITGGTLGAATGPVRFGAPGTGLPGQIDELRLWKTYRSGDEIRGGRGRTMPAATPGLVGAWSFDEGTGALASDGSGTGNPIPIGAATWSERIDGGLAGALISETGANATAFTDRTGASGVRYLYGVAPVDALGAGVPVEEEGQRVQKAPTSLEVTSVPNETNVALAWTDNSASETRQFVVRRAGTETTLLGVDRNVASFVDATAANGAEYVYSVVSANAYGVSAPTETVTGRTILLPAASVSASDTYDASVVVQWVDASAFETGYRVYRDGTLLATTAAGVATYTDATAAAGTLYTYCVATLRGASEATRGCDPGVRPSSVLPATTPLARLTNQLTPSSIVAGDHFGKQVAVQGDYAMVGAPYKYAGGRGAVAFLKRSATGWDVLSVTGSTLDCSAGELGWDVSLNGQYAAAGCWNDQRNVNGVQGEYGAVFIFRRDGDVWTNTQKIIPPSPTPSEYFGVSVEMEGDHLLIGTRLNRVYAYRRDAAAWTYTGTLTPTGAVGATTDFGEHIAISGTTALIGAPKDSQQTNQSGAAYVFTRAGDTWTQQAKLLVSDGVNGTTNYVGDGVDLLGDVALVGASGVTIDGLRQGAAYLFRRTGTAWAQVSRLTAATPEFNAYFAQAVALTEDYVILGSLRASDLAAQHGLAYLYARTGDLYGSCKGSVCVETKRIGPQTVGSIRESFGSAIAGDAESFIVGAQYLGGSNQGSVFPFEMSARPTNVQASDGSYAARVQVTWEDRGNHEESFRVFRNGQKIGEVSANVRTYDDFDALPGDLATYCVSSFRQAAGESGQACERGWRPADGRITGRVATSSATGAAGAGVADVSVCIAPPPNRALLLDGVGAHTAGKALDLGGSEITVEYWFRGTTPQSAVRQQDGAGFIVIGHGNGTFNHLLSNDGSIPVGAGVADGTWHHVAMTWKQNTVGGWRSYLDGVLVASRTSSTVPLRSMAVPVYIGAHQGTSEFAKGQIDEVRIWKRARTQAEIQATLRTTLTGKEEGLALYLPFDQGEGPAAVDMTSGGAHAVFAGGASWTDQAAPLQACATSDVTGAFSLAGVRYGTGQTFKVEASKPGVPANTALVFNGTTSAVRVANVPTAGDELTIAYWFKGASLQSAVRQQTGANFVVAGWNGTHILSNDGGTAAGLPVGAAATDGAWHHVAMTWKRGAANGFVSYLDGDVVAQRAAGATAIPSMPVDLYVGSSGGTTEFTNGAVDEVRVWQRALTQAELRAEMTAAAAAPDRLALALPFSENTGAVTRDASRIGVSATIGGAVTWATRTLGTPGHVFQPALQVVALTAASPVQNSVAFTDVSTYAVAGTVRYNTTSPRTNLAYGTCGVPGATVTTAGIPPVTADDSGDYSLALQPGRHVLTVNRNGLAFTPETISLDLTGDVAGKNFVAGPLRRFILRTETAGGFAIGTHTARIRSEDGCYDRVATTDADGIFLDDLPPLKYTVQVTATTLKANTGLDQIDVDRYFTGLGAQAFDLTEKADTLEMAYHAPLRITVDGFPTADKQACAAPGKLGLPTLAQGLAIPLFYEIVEDFGALGSFPARDVRVSIYDEIADEADTPLDSTIAIGSLVLQTAVGQPNVLSGRVVDGVDRSYQKSIQITATSGARTATRTDWAVVTGQKARNGSFVTLATNPVPLYVLRDPPGDASYSFLEKGSNYCFTLADWSTSNTLGTVSNFTSLFGAHAAFGIGIAIESRLGIGAQGSGALNMSWRREGNTQVCLDAKERFSTSADPEFVGEDADVFIGAAFNMLYAQTDVIKVNGQTCAIEPSTGFGVAPDPTKPISSAYAYSARHIRDVLLPQLKTLKAAATATDTTRYSTYIDNWQRHLDYNAELRRPVTKAGGAGSEQKSFSGGANYAASFTSDTTYYHAWSTHMHNEAGLGVNNIIKTPLSEVSGGFLLKFTRETTFELPGFVGAPRFNGREAYTGTRTTGYVLADKDAGDSYAVNVRPEQAEEVPIFISTRRPDDVAIGYGLTTGAQFTAKVVQKLIASFATQAGKVASQRSNIVTAAVGTGIDLAFGLSQGLYDLSSLLDPENVATASVETRMRVPFGSPVFDLVAGTSSCPWLPDPTFSASGGTQRGTLRRDLPTLSIGRTSLVNAEPSKPAVFSLFLGNASESNETRRYVLRSVNERNPNGAVMRVNGTPIHEGVVFSLAPGRQIEATLSVERGPTRFRYDSLQVVLYPECAGLAASLSEKEGAVQTFSVSFKAVSSPVTLYTSPRFDLDFGAIADAAPGDSVALADFTLETIDFGGAGTADDVFLTEVGMEYRPAASAVWTNAFAATRAQVIAASAQGASATTYYTRWKPKTTDVDGAYAFRAYTRSTGGGATGSVYYGEVLPGRIDRKGPLVFGTPEPADEALNLGDDVMLIFDETVAPVSVLADSSAGALAAANLRLVYVDGAEAGTRIRSKAVVSGAGVVLTPVAGWNALEGRLVRAELRVGTGIQTLTDVAGNPLLAARSWGFTVRRSALAWSAPDVSVAATRGVAARFTVNLANGRTTAVPFTLDGLPAWLTPSIRAGTIAPGAVQPILFVSADTLAGGVYTKTLQATIGGGTLPLAVTLTVDGTPTWAVAPAAFQHTMSVTAQLFLKGRPSVDANDVVGAFVNGELRGVANVAPRTSAGLTAPDSNRVSLVVYSNAAAGELVTFKVWDADAAAPKLYAFTSRTLAYQADAVTGTPTRPLAINAPYVPGASSIALNAGWTWVSFNRIPEEAKLANVLAPIYGANPVAGDVVKGQQAFAMFNGTGATGAWVGPLADTPLDPRLAYFVRLSASQELTLGVPTVAADTSTAVPLAAGWSWIGFPRSKRQPLAHALAGSSFSVAPTSGDLIKSQTAFAQYVAGTGWVGSLAEMEPGRGYMMRRAQAGGLTYPSGPPATTSAAASDDVATSRSPEDGRRLDAASAEAATVDATAWAVNPSAFAFNMTAVLALDGATAPAGAQLGAFVADTLRGVASFQDVGGRPMAFLMAYANRASGEQVSFRLRLPDGTVQPLAPGTTFASDALLGSPVAPVVLRAAGATATEPGALPAEFSVSAPAPNPFTDRTTLRYALPSAEHVLVEVYDVTGRRVARLVDGVQAPGRYAVALEARGLASGVYVLRLSAGPYAHTAQLVRVR